MLSSTSTSDEVHSHHITFSVTTSVRLRFLPFIIILSNCYLKINFVVSLNYSIRMNLLSQHVNRLMNIERVGKVFVRFLVKLIYVQCLISS